MPIRSKAAQSTEAKILLLCAQTELCHAARNTLIELLQTDVDYSKLIQLAEYHGIYTFLHQHLVRHGANLIPPAVLVRLRQSARIKARHNFFLAAELLRIKTLFDERNIRYLSFKGPCLAIQAYRSLSQRVFLDLDLIVSPDDVPKAIDVLSTGGYSQEPQRNPPMSTELMRSQLFRRFSNEQSFAIRQGQREDPAFVVDLHWNIAEHSVMHILPETLHQFATEVDIFGRLVPTLQVELALVLLCAHGTKHHWELLKWLVDIYELLRSHPSLDWNTVYSLSKKYGASNKVDLALWLCAKELGNDANVPQEALSRVAANERLLNLAARTVTSWFDSGSSLKDFRHYLQYHASTSVSPIQAAQFLLQEICCPTLPTYLRCPLPEKIFFLYFLIHPAFLVADFLVDNLIKSAEPERSGAIGHAH